MLFYYSGKILNFSYVFVSTMSPIQMVWWSAFLRTNFPKCYVFSNVSKKPIVGLLSPLSRKTLCVWISVAKIRIMGNTVIFCPRPNIPKKVNELGTQNYLALNTIWLEAFTAMNKP